MHKVPQKGASRTLSLSHPEKIIEKMLVGPVQIDLPFLETYADAAAASLARLLPGIIATALSLARQNAVALVRGLLYKTSVKILDCLLPSAPLTP